MSRPSMSFGQMPIRSLISQLNRHSIPFTPAPPTLYRHRPDRPDMILRDQFKPMRKAASWRSRSSAGFASDEIAE
jgi:hypothetical protein